MDLSARHDRWFEELATSPQDRGSVALCVLRTGEGVRELPSIVELTPEGGVAGDAWLGEEDRDPKWQVSLINVHVVRSCAETDDPARTALSGDNFHVDLDLTTENLPTGTRLRLGTAELVVSPHPHLPCKSFHARFGALATQRVGRATKLGRRGRGVLCTVTAAGTVSVGDVIEVLERP